MSAKVKARKISRRNLLWRKARKANHGRNRWAIAGTHEEAEEDSTKGWRRKQEAKKKEDMAWIAGQTAPADSFFFLRFAAMPASPLSLSLLTLLGAFFFPRSCPTSSFSFLSCVLRLVSGLPSFVLRCEHELEKLIHTDYEISEKCGRLFCRKGRNFCTEEYMYIVYHIKIT